jgi:hypothetical protein
MCASKDNSGGGVKGVAVGASSSGSRCCDVAENLIGGRWGQSRGGARGGLGKDFPGGGLVDQVG